MQWQKFSQKTPVFPIGSSSSAPRPTIRNPPPNRLGIDASIISASLVPCGWPANANVYDAAMAIEQLHVSAVEALARHEPVMMLNLMRFNEQSLDGDGTGWDAYVRYSKLAVRLIKERGGQITWAGSIDGVTLGPESEGDWHYAALVFYPTPGAFLDMMHSDDYARANVHRTNGCAEHLIMATRETVSNPIG